MANLVISDVCNLRCPYCFAQDYFQAPKRKSGGAFLSLEDFKARLEFLDRSGVESTRLIGGEPTLHPRFPEIISWARRRGKPILVFTHGLLSESVLDCLEHIPPQDCTVLVNMNATRDADNPDGREQERRRATLRRLGPRVKMGFNIYRLDFQLDFLLPVVDQTGCRGGIRLGLAHPILSGANRFLHPKQYAAAGRKIALFARKAAASGVRVEFDCGFVRCMFSDSDLDALRRAEADIGWRCNPIFDVDLEGRSVHCFPLAGMGEAPSIDGRTAAELRAILSEQTRAFRTAGVYRECSRCPRKESGECTGGCLAATIRRFRHTANRMTLPLKEERQA
jgi:hypothetical protein